MFLSFVCGQDLILVNYTYCIKFSNLINSYTQFVVGILDIDTNIVFMLISAYQWIITDVGSSRDLARFHAVSKWFWHGNRIRVVGVS